jgi:hypothetical protein
VGDETYFTLNIRQIAGGILGQFSGQNCRLYASFGRSFDWAASKMHGMTNFSGVHAGLVVYEHCNIPARQQGTGMSRHSAKLRHRRISNFLDNVGEVKRSPAS